MAWTKYLRKRRLRGKLVDSLGLRSLCFLIPLALMAVAAPVLNSGLRSTPRRASKSTRMQQQLEAFSAASRQVLQIGSAQPSCTTKDFNSTFSIYPADVFTEDQRAGGAILLHIIFILFTFVGIAIICDEFFEPVLAKLCDALKLREDVAGATFMAAGGSAPELFTAIIDTFFVHDDLGFSTIMGSAVFNVLFVIAICTFVAPNMNVTWWPMTRDATLYCLCILLLTRFSLDNTIEWWEALTLFLMYFMYLIIMRFNTKLEVFMHKQAANADIPKGRSCEKIKRWSDHWFANTIIYLTILLNLVAVVITFNTDESVTEATPTEKIFEQINNSCSIIFGAEMLIKIIAWGFFGYWKEPMNAFDGSLVLLIFVELVLGNSNSVGSSIRSARMLKFARALRGLRVVRLYRALHKKYADGSSQTEAGDFRRVSLIMREDPNLHTYVPSAFKLVDMAYQLQKKDQGTPAADDDAGHDDVQPFNGGTPLLEEGSGSPRDAAAGQRPAQGPTIAVKIAVDRKSANIRRQVHDNEENDYDEPFNPFEIPHGVAGRLFWGFSLPLAILFRFSIPDVRRPGNAKLFPLSFFMCILWLSILCYFMVWMAVIAGETIGIDSTIMGILILSAGTSIPDLLSSVAVARKGLGDMAVSSSIGSNLFDVTVGLPLPWFLYTVIYGDVICIYSENLVVLSLALFVMIAAVVLSIHFFEWKMSIKLGYGFLLLYVFFMVLALSLELAPE